MASTKIWRSVFICLATAALTLAWCRFSKQFELTSLDVTNDLIGSRHSKEPFRDRRLSKEPLSHMSASKKLLSDDRSAPKETAASLLAQQNTKKTFTSHESVDKTVLKNAEKSISKETAVSKPKQHLACVKVHKAASSTLHNIITRFAITYDLDMLLPMKGIHINQNDYPIMKNNTIPKDPGAQHHSVMCSHLIFNHTEWKPWFPKDTVYVGTLRSPFRQFLSAFVYYSKVHHQEYFKPILEANKKNPVEEFLNNTKLYMKNNTDNYVKGWEPNTVMINNRMAVDFGFPLQDFEASKTNKAKISAFIKHLDSLFDIILIAEMFDESLVLLRRRMNWETKDIIYMNVNVFAKKNSTSWIYRKQYPDHTMDRFAEFAALDIALYDHFYDKFLKQIQEQEKDFQEEVIEFKKLNTLVAKQCLDSYNKTESWFANIPATSYTSGFNLTSEDCALMQYEENVLTGRARNIQLNRLHLDHHGRPLPLK